MAMAIKMNRAKEENKKMARITVIKRDIITITCIIAFWAVGKTEKHLYIAISYNKKKTIRRT